MVEHTMNPQTLAEIVEQGQRTTETRAQTKAFLDEIAAFLTEEVGQLEADVGTKAQSNARKIQFIDRAYFYLAPDLRGTYFPLLTVYLFPGRLWWGLHAWGKESFAEEVRAALQDLNLAPDHEVHVGTGAFHADEAWGGGGYVSAGRQLSADELYEWQDVTALAREITADLAQWWRRLQPNLPALRKRLDFVEDVDVVTVPANINIAARLQQWQEEATDPEHANHYHANLDFPAQDYSAIMALVETLRENPDSFTREDVVALFDHLNSGTRMKNKIADNNTLPDLRRHLRELLDGEDEANERIRAATSRIDYAAENILGELYGWVHAEEAPVFNQCATNALEYLGYEFAPNDYNAFVEAHEQFKVVYQHYVDRLRPDIPLNLEIDKLYNVLDKVDIKVEGEEDDYAGAPTPRSLGEPFDSMFGDYEEAMWVFDFFKKTAQKLGFDGHPDERFSVTLQYGNKMLRMNFGNWMVLDFSSDRQEMDLALLRESVPQHYEFIDWGGSFANTAQEVAVFQIPIHLIRDMPEDLQLAYIESMQYIAEHFKGWKRSPFRRAHRDVIFKAFFDLDQRTELLTSGMVNSTSEDPRYWRITLPTDLRYTLDDGSSVAVNLWEVCRQHGIAVVDFDGDERNSQAQKFMEIKPDDHIVAFLRNKTIGGLGHVTSGFDERVFEERPSNNDYFEGRFWFRVGVNWQPHTIDVDTLPGPVANKFGQQTVLELSEDEFEIVRGRLEAPYDVDDFLAQTHLTRETMAELRDMLMDKRQLILYGPPGTGKTYVAQHLARLLTGFADPPTQRLEIVQFHPAYGYEDFIEGIRPSSEPVGDDHFVVDYPVKAGAFRRFCKSAQDTDGPCVFIIDEINRGNIPRIFGELMLLLEYREQHVTLPYSNEPFSIPKNVFIIGTMNTADRSIGLVDFALRRRFHFFRFEADPELYDRWLQANPLGIPYLATLYRRLSQEAIDDPNFAIGPSHFMDESLNETKLERVWRRSIMPYLNEYYFDQPAKARRWEWDSDFMVALRQRPHE